MSDNWSTALWNLAVIAVVVCNGEGDTMWPISECHLTVKTSTTSLGANSPKASSRLSGGSGDPASEAFYHSEASGLRWSLSIQACLALDACHAFVSCDGTVFLFSLRPTSSLLLSMVECDSRFLKSRIPRMTTLLDEDKWVLFYSDVEQFTPSRPWCSYASYVSHHGPIVMGHPALTASHVARVQPVWPVW